MALVAPVVNVFVAIVYFTMGCTIYLAYAYKDI